VFTVNQAQQTMQLLRSKLVCLAGCGLLAASACGCAGGQWSEHASALAFWRSEKSSVRTRADQLKDLRELGKQIPSANPAEQQRASLELAHAIRRENDPVARAQMVRTISACNTSVANTILTAAVSDSDARVRIAACEGLGARGGAEQVNLLGKTLGSDTDIDVRLAAARALGECHDKSAVEALAATLEDPNPALQVRGIRSLEKVTRRDFGNDVAAWQQYVRGETPQPRSQSIAARFRQLW
jgi:hypothetical protein